MPSSALKSWPAASASLGNGKVDVHDPTLQYSQYQREVIRRMPFTLSPASEEDSEAIIRLQFEACAEDPGFAVIFPHGSTPEAIANFTKHNQDDIRNDASCHVMKVTDNETGELAGFAIWHFLPERSQDQIDLEMLNEEVDLPSDANKEAGSVLIRNGYRKRHEIMGGKAYACTSF